MPPCNQSLSWAPRERGETLQKSSQVVIEHALVVAWTQFERVHDIMPRARGNLTRFHKLYSNGHLILKLFSFFSLYHQLFETNQNTEKTLSILMGLKGSDCIRKAEVKNKNVRIRWEWLMNIWKPVPNSNVPVA